MIKLIFEILLIPILSGLISLAYWHLVVYYGFPMINLFRWKFDGESAYNCLFFEIFLILFCLISVIFCTIQILRKRKASAHQS